MVKGERRTWAGGHGRLEMCKEGKQMKAGNCGRWSIRRMAMGTWKSVRVRRLDSTERRWRTPTSLTVMEGGRNVTDGAVATCKATGDGVGAYEAAEVGGVA